MRRLFVAALLLLAATLPVRAQLTSCPNLFARTQVGNSYIVSTSDICYWVVFTGAGTINVTLPTPGQIIQQGFTETLLPLGVNSNFAFTVAPDAASGNQGTINATPTNPNQKALSFGVGQSITLRIGAGTNWYAQSSGAGGSGSGTITGPGSIQASNVPYWISPTQLGDTGILYTSLLSGTKSGTTSVFVTQGAAKTANTIAVYDANGNITSGSGSGIGTVTSVGYADSGGIFSNTGAPIIAAGTITESVTGNSGGIPYFNTASQLSSTALLGANQVLVGGGIGTAPASIGQTGTLVQVLHGNPSGFPTFSGVDLTKDVIGALPISMLATIANNSILGNVSGGVGVVTPLTGTQVASILDPTTATTKCNAVTSSLSGCVPATGGGTTNFFRADATFAQPPQAITLGTGLTKTFGTDNATPASIAAGDTVFPQVCQRVKTANYTLSFPADNGCVIWANGSGSITITFPQSVAGNLDAAACIGDQSAHGFAIATTTSTFYGISGVSGSSASFGTSASICGVSDGTNWGLTGTTSVSGSLSNTLNNKNIFVGNAGNVAVGVAVTGDVAITNTGVTTVATVNGVAYPASPSTNTVPVVTGANTITYETVPNAALANSTITIHGTSCTLGTACLTDANVAYLDVSQSFTKHQGVSCASLTDAATILVDNTLNNCFTVTLAGNRTLGAPSNAKTGSLAFFISQDGSGNRTLAFNSVYKFTGGPPTLTVTASAKDVVSCFADTTSTYECSFIANPHNP